MNTFAKILRELRDEKGLTQVQLAKELKFGTYTVITNWESGKRMPDIENLKMLADYFKVSIDYLVGREQ